MVERDIWWYNMNIDSGVFSLNEYYAMMLYDVVDFIRIGEVGVACVQE